jgi:hypothetical protein
MQSNQTSSQQGGFFAAHPVPMPIAEPLPCKPARTTGCNYFAPLRPLKPSFCKNLLCPFLPTNPPSFCPVSPKAFLLTKTTAFELSFHFPY